MDRWLFWQDFGEIYGGILGLVAEAGFGMFLGLFGGSPLNPAETRPAEGSAAIRAGVYSRAAFRRDLDGI